MRAIVVVDKNWGIGKNGGLLFNLKKDMQFFRKTTLGKVVCMGRNTLLSFPDSKPLPKRTNIVLTSKGIPSEGCVVVSSLDELFKELEKYNSEDVFVIGGAMLYCTMLPFVDSVLVTKVDAEGDAEVFFENLDENPNFELIYQSEREEDNGFFITFNEYKNTNKKTYGE